MSNFMYDKKESKGSGRRQLIMSRYGVRFHFGHVTSDFNEKKVVAYQKLCMDWLDTLTQKEVDYYRANYYKSTAYVGRTRVEADMASGKRVKPAVLPVAKPVTTDGKPGKKSTKKSAKKAAKKASKKTVKKSVKKAVKKTTKKSVKKTTKKSAKKSKR